MTELKPCPFCGGDARLIKRGFKDCDSLGWFVDCECGATNWFDQWNRRTNERKDSD